MRFVFLGMLALMLGTIGFVLVKRRALVKELALFLKEEKKWWLAPIVLVLLLVMALMIANAGAPWMAFLYPIH